MKTVGGKFYGEGAYGCAFSPSPACTTPETQIGKLPEDNNKVIAKVFSKIKDMDTEWKLGKQMQKIDPKQKLFYYPVATCNTTVAEVKKDPDGTKCSYTRRKKNTDVLPIVKMVKGGMTIEEWVQQNQVDVKTFVAALLPVVAALRSLGKAKMIHHDLKFNNILYDPATKETKVIDFGLMIPMQDAFTPSKNKFLRSKYWLHPPEYHIERHVATLRNPQKEDARRILNGVISMLSFYFNKTTKTILKDTLINKVYGSYCDYEESFMKYFFGGVFNKRSGTESIKYMCKYANKVDIYSLGMDMLYLSEYLVYPSQAEREKFYGVIRMFLQPDPRKRPGPTKATSMLKSLM